MSIKSIEEFENKIAEFYGAPYAVAVDCCTHGIELCLLQTKTEFFTVPTRTYLSVAFLGGKLGIPWEWKEEDWENYYYLGETNIIDAAVLWKENSYIQDTFMCLSFQFKKHLSLGRGGMILTDDKNTANELRKMSFDGREPNIPWRDQYQNITTIGYHYYMTPETASLGLEKLPKAIKTEPKKWVIEDYPDLRDAEVFEI